MKSTTTDMDEHKEQFLKNEFFDYTIRGAFQHNTVYDGTAGGTPGRGRALREALRSSLERLIPRYCAGVSEEDHIQNIVDLSEELSEKHAGALNNKRFRIGTAQKAINLYLKYLWCVGMVPPPPHCPFDANVIGKLKSLPSNSNRKWTELDTIEEYRDLIKAAKAEAATKAGSMSLAAWELLLCNNDYQ